MKHPVFYPLGMRLVFREIALAVAGKWKLPFMTHHEKIDEEFSTFATEAVFLFDGTEELGIYGRWRME